MLDKLVDRQGRVVRLHNDLGHLWRRQHGERGHHAVGELLAHLGQQEGAHAGAGAAADRVCQLEALKTIAAFGLAAHHVDDLVDEFGTFGVVALGPVVAGAGLSIDQVIRPEHLAERAGPDGIHGGGLQVDEDGAGDIFLSVCLSTGVSRLADIRSTRRQTSVK
jgi:hypothetical protein